MNVNSGVAYLTLPSNSSFKYYPNNVTSSYKTHLSTPLRLNDLNYELGLADIQYPNTWFNLNNGCGYLKIYIRGQAETTVQIFDGYYKTGEVLLMFGKVFMQYMCTVMPSSPALLVIHRFHY